jgi:hypothetical protein
MGVENGNVRGPMKDQNGWKIRTKDELQVTYGKPNINNKIKMTRMGWSCSKDV